MNTFNEVTDVREGQDKSGRPFKTITLNCTTFSTTTHPVTGAQVNAIGSSSTQTLNAWAEGVDSPYNHLYNVQPGMAVVGTLETRDVEPYSISDNVAGNEVLRQVSSYTCFVPAEPEQPNYESRVRNAFRWNGHPLPSLEGSSVVSTIVEDIDFG